MVWERVLFTPRAMEHKWALFIHGGTLIRVRGWLRQVCCWTAARRRTCARPKAPRR
ncbi:hypothetical protein [Tahibacter sp.]|uniref:hypothetical protein n=1 Tax=Tahibacter sp. TaxID=2056211 RepID=UPI002D7F2205|nr:hypothetical protein [Tahibacter sp.]